MALSIDAGNAAAAAGTVTVGPAPAGSASARARADAVNAPMVTAERRGVEPAPTAGGPSAQVYERCKPGLEMVAGAGEPAADCCCITGF